MMACDSRMLWIFTCSTSGCVCCYFDAIERVEIAIRVDIAHLLGEHDAFAHTNPGLLHGNPTKKINPKTGKTDYQDWIDKYNGLVARSKEDFVKHYRSKYGTPLPIWVAVELWDFGPLSTFYQGMAILATRSRLPPSMGCRTGRPWPAGCERSTMSATSRLTTVGCGTRTSLTSPKCRTREKSQRLIG